MNVILQPCANRESRKHFYETIQTPIKLLDHKDLLIDHQLALENLYPRGRAPIWGITPGSDGINKAKYDKAAIGDLVLFSREGHIFASGVITLKIQSESLAERLWGRLDNGQTWEYIYFIDELTSLHIPYGEFNSAVGYAPNYVIQGFNVLDSEKSQAFIDYFGLASSSYIPDVSEDEYQKALSPPKDEQELDRVVQRRVRIEQAYLRSMLFSTRTHECALCEKAFPVEFLVAAHIKRRSACTDVEKRDAKNIVMPLCKMGCDELFERGYVVVDEVGCVRIGKKSSNLTPALEDYLSLLVGRKCRSHSPHSAGYFQWHLRTSDFNDHQRNKNEVSKD